MTKTTLNILNDKQLSKIFGGYEYISNENALGNTLKYYISFLPFTSPKHLRVKYNIDDWTQDSNNENLFKRNISQTFEVNDMKWDVLSDYEKKQVIIPAVSVGFVACYTGIKALSRYLSNHSS